MMFAVGAPWDFMTKSPSISLIAGAPATNWKSQELEEAESILVLAPVWPVERVTTRPARAVPAEAMTAARTRVGRASRTASSSDEYPALAGPLRHALRRAGQPPAPVYRVNPNI